MDLSSCFHLCRLHFGTCHQEFFRAHVIVKGRNGQYCSQASLFFLSEREMGDSFSTVFGKPPPPPPPRQGIPLVFSTRISRRTVLEALLALPYFSPPPPFLLHCSKLPIFINYWPPGQHHRYDAFLGPDN